MEISCSFATTLDTPEHIAVAESLGYRRAWCYDSPGLYPDVWMVLARAAERTSTIGLGPGVLVPSLRHPMVNAAAIAALEAWAPGRVAVAVGAGFTGRRVLGQGAMSWSVVGDYVRVVQALLRGEETDWRGARLRMLHDPLAAPSRPIDVPFLLAAGGPKGRGVAAELGTGVFVVGAQTPAVPEGVSWWAQLTYGTVLDEGEDVTSPRAFAAMAPGVALAYHAAFEGGDAERVRALPAGERWWAALEAIAPERRHLAVHEGHLLAPNPLDRLFLDEAVPLARQLTITGTAQEIGTRLAAMAAAGVSEFVYQPAGPDIPRELRAFADASGLSGRAAGSPSSPAWPPASP